MPLKQLYLHDCPALTDLSPLADCAALEQLTIPKQCRDIEFLRRLPRLERLSYTAVSHPAAEFWKEWDAKKGK